MTSVGAYHPPKKFLDEFVKEIPFLTLFTVSPPFLVIMPIDISP